MPWSAALAAAGSLLAACSTTVEFQSAPSGATVTYRGQAIGVTPFSYDVWDQFGWWSTYSFTASHEGYDPQTLEFHEATPADAQFVVPHQVNFLLQAQPGSEPPPPPPPPPTPPPPPAAPPAPPPPTTPAQVEDTSDVQASIQAWAAAWSQRDMNAYLGAYDPDFTGTAQSHAAWVKERQVRIVRRKSITVRLEDVHVVRSGDTARATFVQFYQSGALRQTDHKTLDLKRLPSGKWLIDRESTAP